jgi:hypothetical protein
MEEAGEQRGGGENLTPEGVSYRDNGFLNSAGIAERIGNCGG